jgi:hypothetical protein
VAVSSHSQRRNEERLRILQRDSDALIRYSRLLRHDSDRLHESGEKLRARARNSQTSQPD